MTPKVREDIHMNLPALQKLDSMLLVGYLCLHFHFIGKPGIVSNSILILYSVIWQEILDSMIETEFWYDEGGSRAEGRSGRHGQKWWLPLPQVPRNGLSDSQTKKLMNQGKIVLQVFKAVKSINESVLFAMPVPAIIRDALPKVVPNLSFRSLLYNQSCKCICQILQYLSLCSRDYWFFLFEKISDWEGLPGRRIVQLAGIWIQFIWRNIRYPKCEIRTASPWHH